MPGRHDDSLPARHMLITGGTGSGKTTFVRKCADIQRCPRILLWDPDKSHYALHIDNPRQYLNALRAGIRKGASFRLALSMEANESNFDLFCNLVWAAACASRPMVVVIEELAEVTNAGKARGTWQTLLNRGRKYGLQLVAISQRPQEIDKTTLTQCSTKVTGALDRHVDRQVMARELSTTPQEIERLRARNDGRHLHYLVLKPGGTVSQQRINPKSGPMFSL